MILISCYGRLMISNIKPDFYKFYIVCLLAIGIFLPNFAYANTMDEARQINDIPQTSIAELEAAIVKINEITATADFTAKELAELFLIRAITFSKLTDIDNAILSYNAAIDSKNLSPILTAEAYKNKGLLYYADKQYLKSKDDFVSALTILTGNAELHYYLANAYLGLLEFEEALSQYDQALSGMANNRFLAYFGKASVYFQQKKFEASKQNIQKSLELYKNFAPAKSLLSRIEIELAPVDSQLAEMPPEPSEQSKTNASDDVTSNKNLTAEQVYNLLLTQAFAAKKKDGNVKQISFKLPIKVQTTKPATKADLKAEKHIADTVKMKPQSNVRQLTPKLRKSETSLAFKVTEKSKTKPKKLKKAIYIQLASSKNKKNAQSYYNKMLLKHADLLTFRPYLIRAVSNEKSKIIYQTLLTGFKNFNQAAKLCNQIKAQNSDCFVRKVK